MEKDKLNILRVTISIALITFILFKIDLYEMLIGLRSVNFIFILMAFSTQLLAIPVRSFMWKTSLSVQKIKAPLGLLMGINLIASFFNNFLPTSMGGDIVKAYKISKYSGKNVESITAVIVNRLSGFFALITFSVFGAIFGLKLIEETNITTVVFILLFFSLFLLFFFNSRLIEKINFIKKIITFFDRKKILKQFYESLYIYKFDKKKLFCIYLIALLAQFIVLIYYYFITLSLKLNIPFLYLIIVVPLISILEMLPISINGIGVRESASLFFFTKVGVAPELAVLIGLINYLLRVSVSLIGGIVYIFWKS